MLELIHNFAAAKLKSLWAKYVTAFDERYYCTNSLRGHYLRKFSKNNPLFTSSGTIVFDEPPSNTFDAIYICGVSSNGYRTKVNYPRNVHAAIVLEPDTVDAWSFEAWRLNIRGGRFVPFPSIASLPERFLGLERSSLHAEYFDGQRVFISIGLTALGISIVESVVKEMGSHAPAALWLLLLRDKQNSQSRCD